MPINISYERDTFKQLFDKSCSVNSKLCVKNDITSSKTEEELVTAMESFIDDFGAVLQSQYPTKQYPPEIFKFLKHLKDVKSRLLPIKSESCLAPLKAKFGFESIAGLTIEKRQFRTYFIYPSIFPGLFRSNTANILLKSLPGMGKTLLVSAAVKEIPNAIFFAPLPSDLRGKHEGDTEKAIANVFSCASSALKGKYTKAIIFFDEFDNIAAKSSNPIQARARAALLQSMDGVSSDPRINIIAATNFANRIDTAVIRRFSQQIYVNLPGRAAREWIIKNELAKNYTFPNEFKTCDKGNCEEVFKSNVKKALGNIEKYGYTPASKKDIKIDESYIQLLVEMTGPKYPKNKSQGPDPREYSSNAKWTYGYSASDLTKVMKLAVGSCSQRAISGGSKFEKVINNENKYYIYSQKGDYFVDDDKAVEGKIPREDYGKIVTFDIRQSDFIHAISDYKPTYDEEQYVEDIEKELKDMF